MSRRFPSSLQRVSRDALLFLEPCTRLKSPPCSGPATRDGLGRDEEPPRTGLGAGRQLHIAQSPGAGGCTTWPRICWGAACGAREGVSERINQGNLATRLIWCPKGAGRPLPGPPRGAHPLVTTGPRHSFRLVAGVAKPRRSWRHTEATMVPQHVLLDAPPRKRVLTLAPAPAPAPT